MAAAGMAADGGILPSLLIPAISKGVSAVSRTGTPREETGHWYFFNLEVPLDQEGKFAFKIPDEAVIPPTGDTEFGDLHYKLCLVSKTQRLIGEVYNIRLDGHIGAGGKLYTAPSATSATDILSGIIRATATIEHDRLVLVSHPELNFLTVLGTQTVNLSLSPADPSDSKLALLQNAFCDVQAMFVHRISVKGGKESADFVFEPVKSKCSLQSLATAGSLIPMTLTLEISHYHLRFERFSGPFYVTKDPSNPTRAICFFAPPPNAANAAPITPPASPSESSPPEYSDDQMNYLMASEWFVRVKVAVTAESKVELSGIHKASPGSPHEIVLDVPFGMTILRAKQENALPAYS
ncbi:hypothetical protein BJ742DRAFT_524973 [Cladochytrium replicatum]|nr:hypothetical protein BJ742DRAFT_524973 [Cladochytrium replicatum]